MHLIAIMSLVRVTFDTAYYMQETVSNLQKAYFSLIFFFIFFQMSFVISRLNIYKIRD